MKFVKKVKKKIFSYNLCEIKFKSSEIFLCDFYQSSKCEKRSIKVPTKFEDYPKIMDFCCD